MPDFPHKHLNIKPKKVSLNFTRDGRGDFQKRVVSRDQHASNLKKQISNIEKSFDTEFKKRESQQLDPKDFGLLLRVKSAPDFLLKVESLESKPTKHKDGIHLLNIKHLQTDKKNITIATILVPFGRLDVLEQKINSYANPEKDSKNGVPKNAPLLANITEIVAVAALEALWTEPKPLPENNDLIWWELWVSRAPRATKQDNSWLDLFEQTRKQLGLQINQFRLRLPDNEVVLLKAKRSDLENSLTLLNTLTEVRGVHPCGLELTDLPGHEQHEWIDAALDRIDWPDDEAPSVCILDTGVNRGHPLLENLINEEDLHTVLPQHGVADHPDPRQTHGTPMAGIAAYDDLRNLIVDAGRWVQKHRLESVKLIHEGDPHDPEHYGAVTQEAMNTPVAQKPTRKRVYCLAVTQRRPLEKGYPSSWSAALDASIAGMHGEEDRKVLFISAGNHREFPDSYSYPESNQESAIESPAQSWNAITVGAITHKNLIAETNDESFTSKPVAPNGGLSPFSCTGSGWDEYWPIKPDVVMEGGNLALTQSGEYDQNESLEPISTSAHFALGRPLRSMNATSSATASASRLGAILMDELPGFWPETYRGLMVHSARWNPAMLDFDPHTAGNKDRIIEVLRKYGHGEPYLERLSRSGQSGVTMIIEDELTPYDPNSSPGKAKLHHCNLYDLPWPTDVCQDHHDVQLTLKATLSYYIEPSPGSRCWFRGQKYRYASHLLRYDFKRPTESIKAFKQHLLQDSGRPSSDSKWALGPQLRGKSGSLVQDIWKGSPAELSEMGHIAVFPVKGWFATRSFPEGHEFHNCHQSSVRYSLIISIDAEKDIDLYTSILNQISISA